nr:transposase [Gluconobacter cerinus]
MQPIFSDDAWSVWEPLNRGGPPARQTPPRDLRRTMSAIFWRGQNGTKWRSIPAELGLGLTAAQLFIRWAETGVWPALFEQVKGQDLALGMALLDSTNIRTHARVSQ